MIVPVLSRARISSPCATAAGPSRSTCVRSAGRPSARSASTRSHATATAQHAQHAHLLQLGAEDAAHVHMPQVRDALFALTRHGALAAACLAQGRTVNACPRRCGCARVARCADLARLTHRASSASNCTPRRAAPHRVGTQRDAPRKLGGSSRRCAAAQWRRRGRRTSATCCRARWTRRAGRTTRWCSSRARARGLAARSALAPRKRARPSPRHASPTRAAGAQVCPAQVPPRAG
jgi:hypothetical protein